MALERLGIEVDLPQMEIIDSLPASASSVVQESSTSSPVTVTVMPFARSRRRSRQRRGRQRLDLSGQCGYPGGILTTAPKPPAGGGRRPHSRPPTPVVGVGGPHFVTFPVDTTEAIRGSQSGVETM